MKVVTLRSIALALLAAAIVGGSSGCPAPASVSRELAASNATTVQGVTTMLVQQSVAAEYVELTGTVTGKSTVPLATKLMAEIKRIDAEEGQRVTKGQVLVVLDDREIVAMRSEAAAFRAEANAALGEVAAVRHQAEAGVSLAEAGLAQAQAALADAERDLGRVQTLFAEDVVSRAQMDKSQLAVDVARENVARADAAIAQARASVEQAGSRTPQLEAKIQQAGARDMQAAALQDYAVLRAPFDGLVTLRNFDPGQLAVPGQPILVLESGGGLRVKVQLPDQLAAATTLGTPVDVLVETAAGVEVRPGEVVLLGASADAASRTVPVEIALSASEGLLSGQFVRVRMAGTADVATLRVPQSAVLHEGDLAYVWRVTDAGTLAQAPVETGDVMNGEVVILRGLEEGDRIVVEPAPGLFPGTKIGPATAMPAGAHEDG